jgi:hypothetical protein
VTDWIVVATTLGASFITGTVGYFSARWQGRVGLEQARMEIERLRIQHREDHLRNRQSTYHEFLDQVVTGERMREETQIIFGDQSSDEEASQRLDEMRRNFRHLLNGVRLFGTEDVRAAADAIDEVFRAITTEWFEQLGEAHRAGAGFRPLETFPMHRQKDWDASLERLDAMRPDVAPA